MADWFFFPMGCDMMDYKCDQCGEIAKMRGEQAIDRYESPYIAEYVVCTECGYTIAKDTADKEALLAACKYTLEMIQKAFDIMDHKINYESWMNAEIGLNNAKGELQDVIAKAEQTGD